MKALGYLISALSVVLLGIVAWPKPDEPPWKIGLVVAGMATSIIGMFLRYLSHRKQERKLQRTEQAASR